MKFKKIVVAALAIGLTGAAIGQVIGKAEDQIRWRQSAYHTMAWSMGRIKANVEGTYNKDQVIEAANVIQAIVNSKMGALVPVRQQKKARAGRTPASRRNSSPTGKGWARWRTVLGKEGNEMAKVAATGDLRGNQGAVRQTRRSLQGLSR
jgi:hypothetical protein